MFTSKDRALLLHSVVCMCVCYILRPSSVLYSPHMHGREVGRRQSAVCQASHSSAAERKTWACLLKGWGVPRICLGGRRQKAVSCVSGLSFVGSLRETWACLLKGWFVHRICLGGRQNFKAVTNVSGLSIVGKFKNIFASEGREKNINLISGL